MKLAATLASLLLAVAILGGCGSSEDHGPGMMTGARQHMRGAAPPGARAVRCEMATAGTREVRATGMPCGRALSMMAGWRPGRCLPARGGSRAGCRMGRLRCVSVASGRGYSVSCAAPGRSIAFTVPRR